MDKCKMLSRQPYLHNAPPYIGKMESLYLNSTRYIRLFEYILLQWYGVTRAYILWHVQDLWFVSPKYELWMKYQWRVLYWLRIDIWVTNHSSNLKQNFTDFFIAYYRHYMFYYTISYICFLVFRCRIYVIQFIYVGYFRCIIVCKTYMFISFSPGTSDLRYMTWMSSYGSIVHGMK